LDATHEWIFSRTGIAERRVAGPEEDNISLSLGASREAIERAACRGEDVDLVIVATTTSDRMVPALACSVQKELGASGPAFDINAACCGFIYALAVAFHLMRGQMAKKALVIGTETLTRILDWTDRSTCVLFGDGAGAVLLEPCDTSKGILSVCMGACGDGDQLIHAAGGGARMMASLAGGLDGREDILRPFLPFLGHDWNAFYPFLQMDGKEVYKFAVRKLSETVENLCAEAGVDLDDIGLIVPHQANYRIIEAAASRLGLPLDRFYLNMDRFANTSAASVPIALEEALRSRRISKGDLVILVGFGAGLTWGGVLIRWTMEEIKNARELYRVR
jgi:3-oxoacyl-[acyl-carrier-protein] synthase-3